MLHFNRRFSAAAFASLLAAAVAPLALPAPAGAATSNVAVSDNSGDPKLFSTSANNEEPTADITAATARYQNDHISFTMKLAKAADLSKPRDRMFWTVGDPGSAPALLVEFTKGTNGFGQVGISSTESDAPPVDCPGSSASFDAATATYMASIPAKCVESPGPFQWNATRWVYPATGDDFTRDIAPDNGLADAITNTPVFGYWAIGSDGKVYNFGDAPKLGEPASPAKQIIDIEAAPHGTGYWAMDEKGVVTAFGPVLYGSVAPADLKAGEKAVSISNTPSGAGYWIFTNQGRVFAFGDANKNIGDVSTLKLNDEILDSSVTPTGKGYYLVAADGGVFALGDANFEGSMGDTKLNKPVQSIVPDPDGQGYWLVASDGGVFAFKAPFKGSTGNMTLNKPMTGMVPYGNGYLMVAEDGGVFNYSDKPFSGSLGNNPPANPIVSISALS